jgi:hypothetical protein
VYLAPLNITIVEMNKTATRMRKNGRLMQVASPAIFDYKTVGKAIRINEISKGERVFKGQGNVD